MTDRQAGRVATYLPVSKQGGEPADTTAPAVTTTKPANKATGVRRGAP